MLDALFGLGGGPSCLCGWGLGFGAVAGWCACAFLWRQVLLSVSPMLTVQTTELHAVVWAVRLAVRLGMSFVTVCSDSEVALAQVLSRRACSHLQHPQAILRSLARVLWVSGLVVRFVWVPSDLPPGDPMCRVNSEYEG